MIIISSVKLKENEKITLRPNKKIAPTFLGYLGLAMYFFVFVSFVLLFIGFFAKQNILFIVGISVLSIDSLAIVLCDNLLAWYYAADIQMNAEDCLFTYTKTTVAPSNQNLIKYKINSISKIKKTKNKLTIYGDINLKVPYKKERTVNKCVIFDYTSTENYKELLDAINLVKEKER